jgi:hypothetical protein
LGKATNHMSDTAPTAITLPTIHMNGTGIKTLVETYGEAADALQDFIERWGQTEFNSRDYYPQGPEAWNRAVVEREAINAKIRDVRDYLAKHREHFCDHQNAIASRGRQQTNQPQP